MARLGLPRGGEGSDDGRVAAGNDQGRYVDVRHGQQHADCQV